MKKQTIKQHYGVQVKYSDWKKKEVTDAPAGGDAAGMKYWFCRLTLGFQTETQYEQV